jgi:hypothetical protein
MSLWYPLIEPLNACTHLVWYFSLILLQIKVVNNRVSPRYTADGGKPKRVKQYHNVTKILTWSKQALKESASEHVQES